MRKWLIILFLILSSVFNIHSQNLSIKGTITDTIEKKNLSNTVVSLLKQKDSTLIRFTRTDKEGNFSINNLAEGTFILMVTHPYFGDYFDTLHTGPALQADLGKIFMVPKSRLLAEVIIKSGAPIRIKGDTTVYTADSFKVREGANVEELLRRLPGIQVDKDGNITAMGEKVKTVLVDGEEFFGDDPGIATKNLRADVVKEVEVFDKKSDQAAFTGIDDGVKDKTINLKLKDEKKKGYFGKTELAGGEKDKYTGTAMINAFKGKRKLAAYGIMSNTGQTNLDWQDAQNYGGGMDNMQSGISDDGGMYIMFNGNGDDNYRDGQNGIPKNWNGGLHYSNKFNDNKQSLNAGYKYSKINAEAISSAFSKTFLPDTSWSSNSRSNKFSSTVKHAFNLTMESNIDSMNSIKWTTKANSNNGKTNSSYYTETLDDQDHFVNNSTRNSNNNADNKSIASALLWKHKFKKLSRTLSVNTDLNWNRSNNDGFLYSLNNYFVKGLLNRRDTTNQQNVTNSEGKGIVTKFSYTEPLMKDVYMELNYTFSYNNNSNNRITSVPDLAGKYADVVDSLSNSFVFNRLVNTPGVNFRLNKKKYNFSVGNAVGFNRFTQKNITADKNYHYNFVNFFPQTSFTYKFKPNQNFRFNYNGSSHAPSLEQLQPTRNNTDPLNIYTGNQNLKQSFRHRLSASYNLYNVLKEKNIWTNLSYSFTHNDFTESSRVDSVGKNIYQTVNTNGIYNIDFYGDYGFKIEDTKWRLGFGPRIEMNKNIDFINGVKNSTKTNSYGISLNAGQYISNKYNFRAGPSFSIHHSRASVNAAANADYWQLEGEANASITLPRKFEFNTDANIQIRQKDPRFSRNNNFGKWNASVVKRFSKDMFELSLGVFDILNQNRGYDRNFDSYSFTESYYTTLKRFWLLTFTWNVSKNGKPNSGF